MTRARALLQTNKLFMQRGILKREFSKVGIGGEYYNEEDEQEMKCKGNNDVEYYSAYWVPHPRTGIYIPEGQEGVMKDVPDTAASFRDTFWLRNINGVEKPDPLDPAATMDIDRYCFSVNLHR